MSKHEQYLPIAGELLKIHPEWKSDRIAQEIGKGNPDVNISGLGRYLRSKLNRKTNGNLKAPKILLFDIETAPMIAYTWTKFPDAIGDDMLISDWFIICWSAKWLFDDEIHSMCQTSKEILKKDDERITKGLWKMFEEADVIIAHNLNKFDRKRANTRFLAHGLGFPTHYESIDTLLHVRKQFAFPSNRLDYVAKHFFKIEGKKGTSKGLWWRCMEGDQEALDAMQEYCDQDIRVLEDVYLRIRPYIKPHPNIGLHIGEDIELCPTCGSDDLDWTGTYRTQVNAYDGFRCKSCKATGRSRTSNIKKEVKKSIVRG